MGSRSSKELTKFIEYCEEHPEERFWQALRNWSGYSAVLAYEDLPRGDLSSDLEVMSSVCKGFIKDTFHKE